MILYEYPFNERIRTYLRLEHLFRRLAELMFREHPLDHHFALITMFEVMDVAGRADLKSEVMKDLERHKSQLMTYRGNPAIEEAVLEDTIGAVDHCFNALLQQPGKAGLALTENDWLMSIRSRANIPGGTCEFDLPAYFHWQHLPPEKRGKDLSQWAQTLAPLAESIQLLLKIIRDAGVTQKVMAVGGQLQKSLPQGRAFQLLRLRLPVSSGCIPEISGNRLMVSIRFMEQDSQQLMHLSKSDVGFDLTLCT